MPQLDLGGLRGGKRSGMAGREGRKEEEKEKGGERKKGQSRKKVEDTAGMSKHRLKRHIMPTISNNTQLT